MNMHEMGQVFAYLLKYRCAESKIRKNRSHRPGETDIVDILESSEADTIQLFHEFLSGQGLQLREYRDTDFKGIPNGGRVWLLMRNPTERVTPYLGADRIHQIMSLRENEARLTTSTWFLHIWMMYLALVYTRHGRGVSQISEYQDAIFTKSQLIDAVESHIENIRKIGTDKGAEETVFAILDASKGRDIARRVRGFIDLMLSAGLIESIDDDVFQQTLLGAAEFAESYGRTMRHYLNIEDDSMESLVNVTSILTAGAEEKNEDLDNVSD
jgi:hypothetical protein